MVAKKKTTKAVVKKSTQPIKEISNAEWENALKDFYADSYPEEVSKKPSEPVPEVQKSETPAPLPVKKITKPTPARIVPQQPMFREDPDSEGFYDELDEVIDTIQEGKIQNQALGADDDDVDILENMPRRPIADLHEEIYGNEEPPADGEFTVVMSPEVKKANDMRWKIGQMWRRHHARFIEKGFNPKQFSPRKLALMPHTELEHWHNVFWEECIACTGLLQFTYHSSARMLERYHKTLFKGYVNLTGLSKYVTEDQTINDALFALDMRYQSRYKELMEPEYLLAIGTGLACFNVHAMNSIEAAPKVSEETVKKYADL